MLWVWLLLVIGNYNGIISIFSTPFRETLQMTIQGRSTETQRHSRSELYGALYELNAGIEETLQALVRMRRAGLIVPFINGHIILVQKLQAWVKEGVMGMMNESERIEWEKYENQRRVCERALRIFCSEPGTLI